MFCVHAEMLADLTEICTPEYGKPIGWLSVIGWFPCLLYMASPTSYALLFQADCET